MTHATQFERLAIGIGFSSRVESEEVIRLIKTCVDPVSPDMMLASVDRRALLAEAIATELHLRLVLFPSSVLAKVTGVTTYSSLALATTHTANVAEASALASLGPEAYLIVPQQRGRFCTCAVAAVRTKVL